MNRALGAFSLILILGCGSTPTHEFPNSTTGPQNAGSWEDLESVPPPIAEATSRDVIKKTVEENVFTIDRGLKEYEDYFGPQFIRDLQKLKANDHWIDGGSGNAYAQKDFLGSRDGHKIRPNGPKLTAITLKYPENQPKNLGHGQFIVLSGRYFEDIPTSEIRSADLITDVVGILNYSDQLDVALTKYLDLLKPNGKIYVFIPNNITFIKRGQRSLPLTEWLTTIPGLWIRPVYSKRSPYPSEFTFTIEKVGCGIQVPPLRLSRAVHPFVVMREFEEVKKD
jgi:SAM-dependent methyltransferase